MKNITVVTTAKEHIKDSLIYPNVKDFNDFDNKSEINCIPISNNTKSLSEIYNTFINETYKHEIIVFIHDDVTIDHRNLKETINNAINEYDIIGVAGIKAPITLKEPCLWHLTGPQTQYSGAIAHFKSNEPNKRFMTSFGLTPERVVLLDGVFLAVNVEKLLKCDIKFDTTNPARFHYYDLDFCLTANKAGLKLGTWPIWLTHKSHGLTNPDAEFISGQKWFLNKWCNS